MTDRQWESIEPMLPLPKWLGRPSKHDRRAIVGAIRRVSFAAGVAHARQGSSKRSAAALGPVSTVSVDRLSVGAVEEAPPVRLGALPGGIECAHYFDCRVAR